MNVEAPGSAHRKRTTVVDGKVVSDAARSSSTVDSTGGEPTDRSPARPAASSRVRLFPGMRAILACQTVVFRTGDYTVIDRSSWVVEYAASRTRLSKISVLLLQPGGIHVVGSTSTSAALDSDATRLQRIDRPLDVAGPWGWRSS